MTTLHLAKSIGRSPLRFGLSRVQPIWIIRGFLLITLLACFALSPTARAVSPAPDGGYPGENTAEGDDALFSLTTGTGNTAIGFRALYRNTTGGSNTANGFGSLFHNTTGYDNTATGVSALLYNTTGISNTATGVFALASNTTGSYNTANGFNALYNNTTGYDNMATGSYALYGNTTGINNTANGFAALFSNTIGFSNTASGSGALVSNTTGNSNTATGVNALVSNKTGIRNTADGFQALLNNTGSNNIGLGYNAGSSLTTGSGNVCIGAGVLGVAAESNTTRIKNVYASVASGRAVYVNSDNKIGTLVSSRRFKDEIKPMDKASEAILALKPVTFRYKKEIEPNGAIMFGLIAEEVEQVDPELVTRNDKGEPETVRYDAVNAMLLNEFLKEHRKVEQQEKTIAELKSGMETLTATMKQQASQIQKVSAQLELGKSSPRAVVNNH
jgi:Chaperone of endosialidase